MDFNSGIAHVKWFQESVARISPGVNSVEFLFIALFLIASLGAAYFLQKKYLSGFEELISRLAVPYSKYVPLIVRVTAGAGLLATTLSGYFLAPNLDEPPGWLLILQGLIAATFLIGAGVRTASLVLLLVLFLAMVVYNPLEIAEHLGYAGAAGYLMIMGPGAWSLKEMFLRETLPGPRDRQRALRVFMIASGISLAWLGLSEKILYIDLAQSFLITHNWNVLSAVGVSDRLFILLIGATELLLGLLLILNLTPRIATTMIALAMISTAIALGASEVSGHLYSLGLFAAVWANDGKYQHH